MATSAVDVVNGERLEEGLELMAARLLNSETTADCYSGKALRLALDGGWCGEGGGAVR